MHTGLELYPSAVEATTDFKVTILPCVVTTYTPPTDLSFTYAVGQGHRSISWSFAQVPCSYEATYTAKLVDGTSLPSFMKVAAREPYFSINTKEASSADHYQIEVTATLDNTLYLSAEDGVFNPLDPFDPDNPDLAQVFSNSFTIDVTLIEPPAGFVVPRNTEPYFVPKPHDLEFNAGEAFEHSFGKAFDLEIHNVTVEVDFGEARKFASFSSLTNSILVQPNATDISDVLVYNVKITLTDDAGADVDGPGVTEYKIKLSVNDPLIADKQLRDKNEVYQKYGKFVYDL